MTKTLKCLMLMLVATFSLQFTACSDDDEPNSDTSLADTSWRVISETDVYGEKAFEGDYEGSIITFHKDGNVSFEYVSGYDDIDPDVSLKWHMSNDKLRLVHYYKGELSEYNEGPFVVNGKNATYTYTFFWYDYNGTLHEDDEIYVMELQKVK